MTSDRWLKMLLKKMIYRLGVVNSLSCGGMSMGNKDNSCCRVFRGRVSMEIANGAVY